jgi:mRNA interferase MazF
MAGSIQRGDIYRVNLEPTLGSEQQGAARTCVVLSITPFNKQFKTVGVIPLSTSARAHAPVSVSVPSAGEFSVALCYQLRTVDKVKLLKRTGELSAADMAALEAAVKQVYGLS